MKFSSQSTQGESSSIILAFVVGGGGGQGFYRITEASHITFSVAYCVSKINMIVEHFLVNIEL